MNIRQAILKAADHIERNPGEFRFSRITVPTHCGTPGCAAGWVLFFLGKCVGKSLNFKWLEIGDASGLKFYKRMTELSDNNWIIDARKCARALRLYADKYHPAKEVPLPDWNAMASRPTVPADVELGAHQVAL